jgi:hypothetical protein
VLPSEHGETWGLVVNEALASRAPAIASTSCGCTEDLLSSTSGRRSFAAGDVRALAEVLMTVRGADTCASPSTETLLRITTSAKRSKRSGIFMPRQPPVPVKLTRITHASRDGHMRSFEKPDLKSSFRWKLVQAAFYMNRFSALPRAERLFRGVDQGPLSKGASLDTNSCATYPEVDRRS